MKTPTEPGKGLPPSPSPPRGWEKHPESVVIEGLGVDETVITPWPFQFGSRFAVRVAQSANRSRWILVSALLGLFSLGFMITILSVSLERIARELGSDISSATWVVTGPLLAVAVAAPTAGKLGDTYGRRRVYLWGMVGASVFAALTAAAPNMALLVLWRILGAVVGAAIGPASMAMVVSAYPPEERVRALGWWSLVGAGAPALGVVVGGPAVEAFGWRWIFVAQVVFTLLALVLAALVLPQSERRERRSLDLFGSLLAGFAFGLFLLFLNRGPVMGWTHPFVLLCALAGPLLFLGFVFYERRLSEPLISFAYFGRRNFTASIVALSFSNAAYMGIFVITPLFLENMFGYGETRVGVLSLPRPVIFAISAPVMARFTQRMGERLSGLIGTASVLVSMLLLARLTGASSSWEIMGALAFSGLGLGIASPALSSLVTNSVAEEDLGIAGATQQLLSQFGAVSGIQILQTVQHSRAGGGLESSFTDAYWVAAGFAALGIVAAWFCRSLPRATWDAETAEDGSMLENEEGPEPVATSPSLN